MVLQTALEEQQNFFEEAVSEPASGQKNRRHTHWKRQSLYKFYANDSRKKEKLFTGSARRNF
jgi:hypothetical protein